MDEDGDDVGEYRLEQHGDMKDGEDGEDDSDNDNSDKNYEDRDTELEEDSD